MSDLIVDEKGTSFLFDPDNGLYLPLHPTLPSSARSAQDLKKKSREVSGKAPPPPPLHVPNVADLERHVRGRGEAAAQVIIQAAFLRSRRWVGDAEVVTCTGAVYQDARGTRERPRAHRLPANPWLGIFTLPDLAWFRAPRLAALFKEPLMVTDPGPLEMNYADGLFEKSGAYGTIEGAVREVLAEQRAGKAVNAKLVAHVLERAILGFQQAYEAAQEKVRMLIEKDFSSRYGDRLLVDLVRDPGRLAGLNEESLTTAPPDPTRPTENREAAWDYLKLSEAIASTTRPKLTLAGEVEAYAERLEAAAQEGRSAAEGKTEPGGAAPAGT